MPETDRTNRIRSLLESAFSPTELDIRDDSHLHIGHEGAQGGKGHFSIRIVSQDFAGKTALERHRMIYRALGELIQSDIHALRIAASSPDS